MKHELILEGLNCANCAAKIEKKLQDTPEYSDVSFSFATKALSINCEKENIVEDVQQLVDRIEDGVTVRMNDDSTEDEGQRSHTLKIVLLSISGALFIAAFILHFFDNLSVLCMILSLLAVLLSGYEIFIEGIKSAFKLRLDETTLMSVAVIAAFSLGEFVEAAAVTFLFALGEYLEDLAVEKSRRDIRKLADIRPDTALLVENGTTREIPAKDVALGSILKIAPHARIPLDGEIIEGATTVDASSLTGESVPIEATVGTALMSGMLNNDHAILMKTTKRYEDSAASRIIKLVEESAKNKGNSEKLITRFARIYTPVVILIGVLIAVIPSLITGDWALWVKRALVCLVASCPCSIVISVPLAYYAGIGAASKHGVLIKGGRFVEALAKTNTIAFDKTGTITENRLSVKEVIRYGDFSADEVIRLAASAERYSRHPIANAIKEYASDHYISLLELKEYSELSGKGVSATWEDHTVFCGRSVDQSGIIVTVDDRTIGKIEISQKVRVETKAVFHSLKKLGINHLLMLSGDQEEACAQIADELDIKEYHASLLPQDKVRLVEEAIDNNGSCCFIGDGINDAPVLSRSTCGIAMGLGAEAAIESADMVLSSESLNALPDAVRISRSTVRTVIANITFSLLVKVLVISLAVVGFAPLWLAVLADTGVCLLCVLNAVRLIKKKYR